MHPSFTHKRLQHRHWGIPVSSHRWKRTSDRILATKDSAWFTFRGMNGSRLFREIEGNKCGCQQSCDENFEVIHLVHKESIIFFQMIKNLSGRRTFDHTCVWYSHFRTEYPNDSISYLLIPWVFYPVPSSTFSRFSRESSIRTLEELIVSHLLWWCYDGPVQ